MDATARFSRMRRSRLRPALGCPHSRRPEIIPKVPTSCPPGGGSFVVGVKLINSTSPKTPHTSTLMSSKSDYLLLFRGTTWQQELSPQEIEKTLSSFMNWFQELQDEGKIKGANPLERGGKLVSGPNGRSVVDGPFAESKEAIGGYFLISVEDEAEAIAIAQRCPLLERGNVVEVRPVAPQCPLAASLNHPLAELAHA